MSTEIEDACLDPTGYEDSTLDGSDALIYMYDHFSHGGAIVATDCNCGLTHFTTAPGCGDYEDGEADRYLQSRHCVHWTQFDTIHTVDFNGQWVVGCRCGYVERVGKLLLSHVDDLTALVKAYWRKKKAAAEKAAIEATANTTALEACGLRENPWQAMDSAPRDTRLIEVELSGTNRVCQAHYACDLSGEEQPPFKGWFEECQGGFREIAPERWRPLSEPPKPLRAQTSSGPSYARCLDGSVLSVTCDDCNGRHCPDCDECPAHEEE